MGVVALSVGVLIMLLAPVSYLVAARRALDQAAISIAAEIASDVAAVAVSDPYLWQYNLPKVVRATGAHERGHEVLAIEVMDCANEPLFTSEALGFDRAERTTAYAPVVTPYGVVAVVGVAPNRAEAHTIAVRLATFGTLFGLLVAGGLFWLPTRVVRRQYRELQGAAARLGETQLELEKTNLGLEEKVSAAVEQVRELSSRAERVQEQERSRIARELHDTLGQSISALRLELDALERDPDVPGRVGRLRSLNDAQLEDLRRSIRDLRPAELEERTIVAAIEELAETIELRSGVAVSVGLAGFEALPARTAASLFRVVQEALTNAVRHGDPSEIGLRGRIEDGVATLAIRDDGAGGATVVPGHGLSFMRDRLAAFDGTLAIDSDEEGTTLLIEVPTL